MKRVLIMLLCCVLVFSMFACGKKDDKKTETNDSAEIDATVDAVDTAEPEDKTEEADTEEPVDSTDPEDTAEPDDTTDEVTEPADTTTADTTTVPADTAAPPQTNTEGTESNPYLVFPDANMTVTTVTVPAGGHVYYDIYRVGGMILTINDPAVSIIHGGYQYDSDGTKVAIMVDYALASDAVSFIFLNNGSTAKSYKLVFTSPEGSYANPVKVTALANGGAVSLYESDTDQSYYFKYVAEKAGTITFSMQATVDSSMSVQRNTLINGELIPIVKTTEADGTVNGNTKSFSMEVAKGDELMIVVSAIPNARGKYPATDITWWGNYN